MRFIHVGNIYSGLNPDSDRSWGKERAAAFKDALKRVVEKAKETDCDLLLISGNLFCGQPVTRELSEANLLFSMIPATKVVIVAGSLDKIRKNSSVLNFKWAGNVRYVLSADFEKIRLPEIHTTVYAASCCGGEASAEARFPDAAIEEEKKDNEDAIKILLYYNENFADSEAEQQLKDKLSNSGFSYAALGGPDSEKQLIRDRCAYSGAVEPTGAETPGEHGIITGDISIASKRVIKTEFVSMAKLSYIPLRIEVNESTGADELKELIATEIEKRGRDNIYRFRITGKKSPYVEFDLSELCRRYRIEEITDEAEPQYDFSELFAKHSGDIIGFYISSVMRSEEEMSSLEKKAMYYAINALLKTESAKEKNQG